MILPVKEMIYSIHIIANFFRFFPLNVCVCVCVFNSAHKVGAIFLS